MKDMYMVARDVRATACVVQIRPAAYLITRIEVGPEDRGEGYATNLLRQVIEDAEAEGAALHLGVSPDDSDGLDSIQLTRWYERYGFVSRENCEGYMVRRAQGVLPVRMNEQ